MLRNKFFKHLIDSLFDGVYFVDCDRRITYWNSGAERLSGYRSAEVVGSHCWDDILQHVDCDGINLCRSGCPLVQTLADGQTREAEVELRHKDGHRVPVFVRVIAIRDEDGRITGALEIFRDNTSKILLTHKVENLEKMVTRDSLGIGNRRYVEGALESHLHEMKRYGWTFGVLLIDVDGLKKVSDLHGVGASERILKALSKAMMNSLRSFDVLGRWGPEEFVALVVNVDESRLNAVAERFLSLADKMDLSADGEKVRIAVSIGATLSRPGDTVDAILSRADMLSYNSKSAGGSRVTIDAAV